MDLFRKYSIRSLCNRLLILIWLGTLYPTISIAQPTDNLSFRTLNADNGLSQNSVYSMLQDRQGRMWFATMDGLNVYNGLSFRVFTKANSGLACNNVSCIHEDEQGTIWIGTDEGLFYYLPQTESINQLTATTPEGESIDRLIRKIDSDGKGGILISSEGEGLFRFDSQTNTLVEMFPDRIHDKCTLWTFLVDGNRLWMSLYLNNLCYSDDGKTLHGLTDNEGGSPFIGEMVNALLKMPNGSLLVGTSRGLFLFDTESGEVRSVLDDCLVHCLYMRDNKELWVGCEDGIYVRAIKDNSWRHLTSSPTTMHFSLTDNSIYSIYEDRDGGMWVGSYFGGVNYLPNQAAEFEKYYPHGGLSHFGRRVREFCAGLDGTLWVGTEDRGLFCLNPSTGHIDAFSDPRLANNIHGLCRDGDELWVGTFAGGLARVNLRTRSLVRVYNTADKDCGMFSDYVFSICRTHSGDIYAGTIAGPMRYDRENDRFVRINQVNEFVYHILEDSEGTVWMATLNGVYSYNLAMDKWQRYVHQHDNDSSLPCKRIISIMEDGQRRLWFLTQGYGFCLFDRTTKTFTTYQLTDVIPTNTAYKMLEGNDGHFWISTNNGLVCFSPDEGFKKVYTIDDGLISNQFNYQSGYRSPEGKLYFGCVNGFVAFDPSTFRRDYRPSPLLLTDFILNGMRAGIGADSTLTESVNTLDEVELSANENSFEVTASVLSYQSPLMNRVEYRLEGLEEIWHEAEGNSKIHYSNLPPGKYVLHVKGTNSAGVECSQERTLDIRIHPPFYLSVWAYIFYFIAFVSIAAFILRYYFRRTSGRHRMALETLEQQKDQEAYDSKMQFFTHVAHEIRTPLTLIKSPLEHLLTRSDFEPKVREELELMETNTNRLVTLINQLLDFRRTESGGYRLNFVNRSVDELVRTILVGFEPIVKERELNFNIHRLEPTKALVDPEILTKIMTNLFSNAVKYASTHVEVEMSCMENEIRLTVENDGPVVPLSMREQIFKPFERYRNGETEHVSGTGIGLSLSRMLAELHGGTLQMDDDRGCNRFWLSIPLRMQETGEEVSSEADLEEVEEDTAETSDHRHTILFVDDNENLRQYIKNYLSGTYKVYVAENGRKALEVLGKKNVNLIVSDVMMPEMDGLALCDAVKSNIEYSHIPVVLLTAKTTLQSKVEGMKSGADAYLEKPFSNELFQTCIANLLKNREKLYESYAHSPFIMTRSLPMTTADSDFVKKLHELVEEHMSDSEFGQEQMAQQIGMSRASLYRKIKGLLDLTPNDFLKVERLKRAAQLLRESGHSINEICYMVGFATPSYFSKCFQKQFGVLPKEFQKH